MKDTPTLPHGFSDQELARLLALMDQADSVELKLTLLDSDRRSAVASLEMDPLQAKFRQVFFFDTPDLTLNQHGLVVRARRIQGGRGDSVVKLRPVVPRELPARLRKSEGFGVEVDAMPSGFVCSGRLKAPVASERVREAAAGTRRLRSLFTKQQRAFFAQYAPPDVGLEDLSILGPITVLKLKFAPTGYAGRLTAELWNYPDGSRILELSTKCAPSDAFQVAAETRVFLAERGINLTGDQQTKTKTALETLSKQMSGPTP